MAACKQDLTLKIKTDEDWISPPTAVNQRLHDLATIERGLTKSFSLNNSLI